MLNALMSCPSNESSRRSADPDEELSREARKAPGGGSASFRAVNPAHQRRVVANCRYITRDPNNAEDLAQEVLVKAFFGAPQFRRSVFVCCWLQRIKINHCLDHLKKQAARSYVGIEEPDVEEFDQLKDSGRRRKSWRERSATSNSSARFWIRCQAPSEFRCCSRDMDKLSYEEVARLARHQSFGNEDAHQACPRGISRTISENVSGSDFHAGK